MKQSKEIQTIQTDETLGIFMNKLFPVINGSSYDLRAERVPGKPASMLVSDGFNQFTIHVSCVEVVE